jgi:hypothetical protein
MHPNPSGPHRRLRRRVVALMRSSGSFPTRPGRMAFSLEKSRAYGLDIVRRERDRKELELSRSAPGATPQHDANGVNVGRTRVDDH